MKFGKFPNGLMNQIFNYMIFYIKEAFRIFRYARLLSFLAVFVLSISIFFTLISVDSFVLSNKIDNYLINQFNIHVYLTEELNADQLIEISKKINEVIETEKIDYISKEEAKREFILNNGDEFKEILDFNPLPASLKIKLKNKNFTEKNLASVSDNLMLIPFIDEVQFDSDILSRVLYFIESSKYILALISIVLVFIGLGLVYVTENVMIKNNSENLNTMILVGATNLSIRIPIIINGFLLGIIAFLICALLHNLIFFLLTKLNLDVSFTKLILFNNLLMLIWGVSLGIIGSIISTRNKKFRKLIISN